MLATAYFRLLASNQSKEVKFVFIRALVAKFLPVCFFISIFIPVSNFVCIIAVLFSERLPMKDTAFLISKELNISHSVISKILNLLAEDATIPFIARYRKEVTGNLDEVVLYQIQKLKKQYDELEKRKQSILKTLDEQGVLTADLRQKIQDTYDAVQLEDLYLPYKKKRKTKATTAREQGLEPLAKIIMAQRTTDLEQEAYRFVNHKVTNVEKALEGARFIMAEWISENVWVRNYLRRYFDRNAVIKSKLVKSKATAEKAQKYLDYFDWFEALRRVPSHRLLAMLRAENEGFVRLKLEVSVTEILEKLNDKYIYNQRDTALQIQRAIADAYKRLLAPAISTEILNKYKAKADQTAIGVFAENLWQLLLAPPLGAKSVLALDPGFRTGCKTVCLSPQGELLHFDTIYPHAPQNQFEKSRKLLRDLVKKFDIQAIAIGNGTASRETEAFVKSIDFSAEIPVFIVNESGASIYSASAIAREEFPDHDITVRGAVSIGRRLQDPLAELVKIDPKSIGVGQYQHDVNQSLLKEELDIVVERAVNLVGVNVNTASKYLLKYVSGIGEKLAENIVAYRTENGPFSSRTALKNVKRLGGKAFEQAAGFLRIKKGVNPLDDSAVHPESYGIVKQMAQSLQVPVQQLIGNKDLLQQIDLQKFVTGKTGLPTLKDIIKELEKPGLDIRERVRVFAFSADLQSIADVKVGQTYPGIVNNITNFGCFVHIGIKESGLVHISNMSNSYVSNPADIVRLDQQVQVKVISVDIDRKRIGLSLI